MGQRAQATPVSTMIPLLQPPGWKKQSNHLRPQKSRAPPPPPNGETGERRPHENPRGGHPLSPPNGHSPRKEGGLEEQGFWLLKKPRRNGRSLKGVSCCAHYRGAISETLPTDQSLQMSQVTSAEHFVPLHLAHVGCGPLNKRGINAQHQGKVAVHMT